MSDKTYLNGKEVLFLIYRANLADKATLSSIWSPTKYSYGSRPDILTFDSPEDIKKKLNSLRTQIQDNQVLFFGKTSKYPRFKLSDSNLKRCIKAEKADIVIIDNDISFSKTTYDELFEDELYYYVLSSWNCKQIEGLGYFEKRRWENDHYAFIKEETLFYGTELKKVGSNISVTILNGKAGEDIPKFLDGTYTHLAYDQDLDNFINKKMDLITKDDIDSICDMLDSPDWPTKGIGLKMLCGYNVNETPLTIRTIIGTRDFLCNCSEWKSVGVQQVLNSIKFKGFGYFPMSMWNILQNDDKTQTYSDYDKDLCKHIYIKEANKYFEDKIAALDRQGLLTTFGLKVNYEINENSGD